MIESESIVLRGIDRIVQMLEDKSDYVVNSVVDLCSSLANYSVLDHSDIDQLYIRSRCCYSPLYVADIFLCPILLRKIELEQVSL